MTKNEFIQAQRLAREEWLKIFSGTNTEVSKVYISAADEVAKKIRRLIINKKGNSLTATSLRSLEKTLRKTGIKIATGTEFATIDGIDDMVTVLNNPHLDFINDAVKATGIPKSLIDLNVIEKMYSSVNTDVIDITFARLGTDGYKFSQRIWGFVGDSKLAAKKGLPALWQQNIKDVVTSGIAQNRDVLQIAKDIQVYTKDGKVKLIKRYGDLVRGTSKFTKRIPKNVDYRALRIARSELYASLQEASKIQGSLNPAVKAYKWNLTSGAMHECICPDLASDSPYLEGEVPDYPHSNCLCYITYVLKGRDEFVNDLMAWNNGLIPPYLDNWHKTKYLPFLNKNT